MKQQLLALALQTVAEAIQAISPALLEKLRQLQILKEIQRQVIRREGQREDTHL